MASNMGCKSCSEEAMARSTSEIAARCAASSLTCSRSSAQERCGAALSPRRVSSLFMRRRSVDFGAQPHCGGSRKLTRRRGFSLCWPRRYRSFTTISFHEWLKRTMTASGHEQTFDTSKRMSAIPPESRRQNYTPSCLVWAMNRHCKLFNNLISAGKERRRHSEAKCLGRLEVDHQLVFGRALHWKVGGFFALKDSIDVASSLPEWIDRGRFVSDEATNGDEETERIDGSQSVSRRQRDDQVANICG